MSKLFLIAELFRNVSGPIPILVTILVKNRGDIIQATVFSIQILGLLLPAHHHLVTLNLH